jgi:thymidylate synthase (FAD)
MPDGESGDNFPATAARVSFANDRLVYDENKDLKLIKYLADHQHLTPFEYQHATLMIECPLFIRSQIHRHRTFSFNEISRRYTSEQLEFWMPTTWRKQAESNRQASDGEIQHVIHCDDVYRGQCYNALASYEELLECGVGREQARAVLPQSLLTRFYMGGNLRNWAHFLELRLDSHAQYEVQVIASKAKGILDNLWPNSLEALMNETPTI